MTHRIEIEGDIKLGTLVFTIDGIHRFRRYGSAGDLYTLRRDLMEIEAVLKRDREGISVRLGQLPGPAPASGHKKTVTR